MQETITINDEDISIDTRPMTIICPSPGMIHDIEYKNRVPIDSEMTLYHMERLSDEGIHEEFEEFWKVFYNAKSHPDEPPCKPLPSEIRKLSKAHRHVAGMIDVCLKFQDMSAPFVLVRPESLLHPAMQVSIGDFVIKLMNRQGDVIDE